MDQRQRAERRARMKADEERALEEEDEIRRRHQAALEVNLAIERDSVRPYKLAELKQLLEYARAWMREHEQLYEQFEVALAHNNLLEAINLRSEIRKHRSTARFCGQDPLGLYEEAAFKPLYDNVTALQRRAGQMEHFGDNLFKCAEHFQRVRIRQQQAAAAAAAEAAEAAAEADGAAAAARCKRRRLRRGDGVLVSRPDDADDEA
eukprot:tig00000137_g8142.t1